VQNPSFECGLEDCGPTAFATNFWKYVCNWSCPNEGTSDVFSTTITAQACWGAQPNPGVFPPHVGTQLPRTGTRFAGIYIYSNYPVEMIESTWREYLQVELTETLQVGEYYKVEFYVSLAEESNFAANNLGVGLSDYQVYENTYSTIPVTPLINNTQIITDSTNWVKVEGYFQATVPFKFLIIGNFYYDHQTQFVALPNPNKEIPYSYYFVDDVSLEKVPCPEFNFVNNNEICKGDTIVLQAFTEYVNVLYHNATWTTLTDTLTVLNRGVRFEIQPDESVSYRVKANDGCNQFLVDTVFVNVNPVPVVELGNDTILCKGFSKMLDAGYGYDYTWQDNSNSQFFNVQQPGIFSVQVVNQFNCIAHDTIDISFDDVPIVDLGSDSILCERIFYPLLAGAGNKTYQWSTGGTDSVLLPTQKGNYWVHVENQCGIGSDTVNLFTTEDVFIPNVITVNGDETNEQFKIVGVSDETNTYNHLTIINRWGKIVLSESGYNGDWPRPGEELASGIYYYSFELGRCAAYKGWLHVLK
jgi:gliding motility-associated-like protein